jgi:hypothetical protein
MKGATLDNEMSALEALSKTKDKQITSTTCQRTLSYPALIASSFSKQGFMEIIFGLSHLQFPFPDIHVC